MAQDYIRQRLIATMADCIPCWWEKLGIGDLLALSPVHTSKNVEATLSNATSRMILLTVECCFDKFERCFDVVASVNRVLGLGLQWYLAAGECRLSGSAHENTVVRIFLRRNNSKQDK